MVESGQAPYYMQTEEEKANNFVSFIEQNRVFEERRAALARKIEAKQREFNFISKLDAEDVSHMLLKRKEQAA